MSRPVRRRRHLAIREVYADVAARTALRSAAAPPPPEVTAWLERLQCLYGVPFDALVPDARLLPAESVRFFFVDRNWLDSLVDGALSVAATTPANARALAALAGAPGGVVAPTASTPSGVLLRSALVAGWPGLAITGYAEATGGSPMTPLRTALLAPSVLMVIFPGLVRRVEIGRPAAGLSFAVGARPPHVRPRYIGGPGHPAGQPTPGAPVVEVPLRDARLGVLDVIELADRLAESLAVAYRPAQPPALGPAGFGLQLVAPAERRTFIPPEDPDAR